MLYLDILCFLGSVHKGCSIFFCHFLRYLPTSHCPILNCIPKFFLVSIIVAVRWTTSWQWTFVFKRRSARSSAQLAKIVKIRQKIKKKSWNWLCHTITATIKCNDRKRCESAEKFVKSHQGSLFLAGFSHLKPLWCARNLTKACVELMLEALLEKFTLLGPLPPSLNK